MDGVAGLCALKIDHVQPRHAARPVGGQACRIVYVPTSPVPMSGGILFVPKDSMQRIDMKVDDLMQIYFSIGVMSDKVIPKRYVAPAAAE